MEILWLWNIGLLYSKHIIIENLFYIYNKKGLFHNIYCLFVNNVTGFEMPIIYSEI